MGCLGGGTISAVTTRPDASHPAGRAKRGTLGERTVRNTEHDTTADGSTNGGSAIDGPMLSGGPAGAVKLTLAHSNDRARTGTDVVRQTTIATSVDLDGIGLHKGTNVHMVLRPAGADTGIVFRRTDMKAADRSVSDIPARFDTVCDTSMCTTIGNAAGARVATIEHLMAAVYALGIDNLLVEIDAEEVPVMDGSSAAFVAALDRAGVKELPAPRKFIRILEPVSLEDGLKQGTLEPCSDGFRIDLSIDFDNVTIGKQALSFEASPEAFRKAISSARTFGFLEDYELLKSLDLAHGASLDNAVVLDGETVLNEDGLRSPDEFVRHKVLDAVGDLALAGAPILGRYVGSRVGHAFNNQILRALFANPDAWEYVTMRHEEEIEPSRIAVSAD